MELFRHELKKMFFNRKSFFIIMALVLIPAFTSIAGTISYYNENGSPLALYERYRPYEGAINEDLADKAQSEVEKIIKMQLNDRQAFEDYNKQDKNFYYDYSNAAGMAFWYINGRLKADNLEARKTKDNQLSPRSLAGVENRIEQLKASGKENTYEYRERLLQRSMMLEAGTPGFYFNRQWEALFSFLGGGGPVFLSMLLLLLVSPVFSKEYATGMDSIILSSRKGRGSIVAAKTEAALVMAVLVVLLFNLAEFFCYVIPGSFINWDAPLNSLYAFFTTPFDMGILEFFLIHTVYQIVGGVVLTLVTLFFSSKFKSSLVTFFTGMCFAFYPAILYNLLRIRTDWMKLIRDISVEGALEPSNLFAGFTAYNLFGSPVLLVYIVLAAVALAGIVSIFLTYSGFKKRDAC